MKKKTKKWMGVLLVGVVAVVAGYNVYESQNGNVKLGDVALANVEALAADEHDGTIYNRNSYKCTITGNGKVKIAGGNVLEVKGYLAFDGGVYCTSNGNATCRDIECMELWHWIFD
ncbi:MAG: NVEALA domain-containing protein [Mediterranea sp.]|jgi:hypothetical protein|nr:NVEALA domain-containing protein [Mediterranea sp.]